jgi:hypothetical protein
MQQPRFLFENEDRRSLMILGMPMSTFLAVHVGLSLIGIAVGLLTLAAMLQGRSAGTTTALFLAATLLTSITGFPIPPYGFDPPRAFGVVSLVLLGLSVTGLYVFRLARYWRWIYVTTAVAALYLNCFVAVVQTFQKVAVFRALAPTQSEPPFLAAQLVLLAAFVILGVLAVRRFHPAVDVAMTARATAG